MLFGAGLGRQVNDRELRGPSKIVDVAEHAPDAEDQRGDDQPMSGVGSGDHDRQDGNIKMCCQHR